MTDGEAILAAILDAPDDDAVRLVYADWLEENGEADRAEFIRVQVRLATMPAAALTTDDLLAETYPGEALARAAAREAPGRRLYRLRERELLAALGWRAALGAGRPDGLVPEGARYADHVTLSRGFVSAVRLPLAAWVGGPCATCEGRPQQGRFHGAGATNPFRWECPACHGTGRAPAHGTALVRAHPLEGVALTDRGPVRHPLVSSEGEQWSWYDAPWGSVPPSAVLPRDLFRLLTGGYCLTHLGDVCRQRNYRTREGADSALSHALLAWAKAQCVAKSAAPPAVSS